MNRTAKPLLSWKRTREEDAQRRKETDKKTAPQTCAMQRVTTE